MGISTLPQTVHLPRSIKHPFLPTIKPNQFSEAVPKCAYSLPAHSQLTKAPVTAELSRLQQWGRLSQGGRSGPRAAPRLRVVVCLDATVDSRERLFPRTLPRLKAGTQHVCDWAGLPPPSVCRAIWQVCKQASLHCLAVALGDGICGNRCGGATTRQHWCTAGLEQVRYVSPRGGPGIKQVSR